MNTRPLVLLFLLLILTTLGYTQPAQKITDFVSYVNPLMGTDSEFALSNGNTYPAVALPWGMNFWTPQTGPMDDGWGYTYDAYKIRGIKQTHQPSPWINDYAAFSLMPLTGTLEVDEEKRASWFSHKAEQSHPDHYQVYLANYDVTAEVTPTERAASFRFTFPQSDSSYILLDAFNKGSYIRIIPEERKIVGYCRNNHGGVPDNFHNYFVAVFDKDFTITHTWQDSTLTPGSLTSEADHVGAVVGFQTTKGEQVHVKVASSFISEAQAELNLQREIGEDDFNTTRQKAHDAWNQELQKIKVEGGTLRQQRTFYSCLYRVLLFPRKFYELNEQEEIVHYSPYNGKVLPGYMFTDNGFWDTFRAVFPFFTLMYPDLNAQIMEGLANTYQESGWLPEWASPGHRHSMIGSNSASLIADSYIKGIRGYDIETLYEAMLKNTNGVGPEPSVGRLGADYYNRLGYVPYDVNINENTARTLEYAYADFAVWQVAKALKRPTAEIDTFARRSQNYRRVFDSTTKLMRGRNQDGSFQEPFNPVKWGDAFTEGNSWHYTWSVFHDVPGLIDLMGGPDSFTAMLDSVFSMSPIFDDSYYGFPIHEIREMQIANMGQYAHGNQPIQHMPYLYTYAGQPWKTQWHVRNIMDRLYTPDPDGYCGDEDNGQTSAWYVFSALGFYPVCPGLPYYVLGSPLFERATLQLPNGKSFVVEAPNNEPDTPYVQRAELNGQAYEDNFLWHQTILQGGTFSVEMSDTPTQSRGVEEATAPPSMHE